MIPRRTAGLGLGLVGWSAVVAFWAGVAGRHGLSVDLPRLVVVGGFLITGPGLALTALLGLRDRLLSWVVAMGTSVGVLALSAQAALYLGRWSPVGIVRAIALGTAVLASAILVRDRRRLRPPSAAGGHRG